MRQPVSSACRTGACRYSAPNWGSTGANSRASRWHRPSTLPSASPIWSPSRPRGPPWPACPQRRCAVSSLPKSARGSPAGQPVEDWGRPGRGDVHDRARPDTLVLQGTTAHWAARDPGHIDHLRGHRRGKSGPPVAPVARAGAPALPLLLRRTVGFHRAPGRGSGRPEAARGGPPLPGAQLRLQALVLIEELIEAPLRLQAARAEGTSHDGSAAAAVAARAGAGAVRSRSGTSRPSG